MNTPFANTLYYGDCLDIMAGFPDSYIDLICLYWRVVFGYGFLIIGDPLRYKDLPIES